MWKSSSIFSCRCFTSSCWRCSENSYMVGAGLAFVGTEPPSKCLEHKQLCLVTFRFSSWHAANHFQCLPCSLIPEVKFFLCHWIENSKIQGYLSGSPFLLDTTMVFGHIQGKSKNVALTFSAFASHSFSTLLGTVREYKCCHFETKCVCKFFGTLEIWFTTQTQLNA